MAARPKKLPLYHYTSRQAAQDISCSLLLRPGPSGVVYLTPDVCDTGIAAAASLSIQGKPVEFRCEVDVERHQLRGPTRVHFIFGPDGVLLRPGGGAEYCSDALSFDSRPRWKSLASP